MTENSNRQSEQYADPSIALLSADIHALHAVEQDHDWDKVHTSLRSPGGVFDIEQYSDDTETRQRAHERAEQSRDAQVISFMTYLDGCMNVSAVDTNQLNVQLRNVHERAACLSEPGVTFELAEHAVYKIAELETKLRMVYPTGEKTVAGTVDHMPVEMLQEMYFYPSSAQKNSVVELLDSANPSTRSGLSVHARLLTKLYRGQDGDVEMSDEDYFVHQLKEKIHNDGMALEITAMPETPRSSERSDVAEFNDEITRTAAELVYAMGLADKDENGHVDSPYLKSALVRLRNRKPDDNYRAQGTIDALQLKAELLAAYDNLLHIGGAEEAKRLKDEFGVEQLWMYSLDELLTLQRLDEKDPVTIKHLQAGDVTVVFSNAMDDHNGAIVEDANYRKPSGRTLRFEANHVPAIYRQMIKLNALGIRPATLVYETHGAPGAVTDGGVMLWAAEPRGGIIKYDDKNQEDRIMDGNADGLYRLVRDYMQPNRGIDSDDELTGKKQLVVSACSSDKPTNFRDGTRASFVEKVAQMIAYPSDRSIEKGIHSHKGFQQNVVLYGALEDMAEMPLENGRIGFVDHKTDHFKSVTTKRTINEPNRAAKIFGTSRKKITTHSIHTRKGVPVRRAS